MNTIFEFKYIKQTNIGVKIRIGTVFEDACSECLVFSMINKCPVIFDFNGTKYEINAVEAINDMILKLKAINK